MAGAVVLVVLVVVVVATLRQDVRPEETVAEEFLSALLTGDPTEAYGLTSPAYRLLVHPSDLSALADALRGVVGSDPGIDVLGSERTPGAAPPESLVGYTGRTAVGRLEGVVTLVRLEPDGGWLVHDLSYRFPEADPGELAELRRVTRMLNEAIADRAAAARGATPSD